MTSSSFIPVMNWDFADRLKATSRQNVSQGSGQIPETTYYVYDSKGVRIRKVTESQAGSNSQPTPTMLKQTIYLASYEIFRQYTGSSTSGTSSSTGSMTPSLERTTFHAKTEYGHMA